MRVSIHTLGTRGDVQPYLALAIGLTRRGHDVALAAPSQFGGLVRAHGIEFHALPSEFLALLDTAEGKAAVGERRFGAGLALLREVKPLMRRLFDAAWEASRSFGPDVVVHHPKALAAPHIAERLGCPAVLASPIPGFTPTSEVPSPFLPVRSLGPLNRASHAVIAQAGEAMFGGLLSVWRAESLGLPPRRSGRWSPLRTIYGYSPAVVPRPADWGDDVLVSGYWFLDAEEAWSPPPELAAFLATGPPPVYVGFGSMPAPEAARVTAVVLEALARCGQRGLLAWGGGGLAWQTSRPTAHMIEGTPHDWLFPRVAAVVHHGGAGTTAAGLQAGKPSVICPFFGDQPFWGRRVAELGAGPAPIRQRDLTPERLAAAIGRVIERPELRLAAERLGETIRAENGVCAAAEFLEQAMRERTTAPRP